MNLSIDKSCKTAAYKQLSEQIEKQILSGTLKPGDKLPTERMLEEETGLSRGTIKTAFRELQKSGKIITIQGSGSFVAKYNREESRRVARETFQRAIEQMRSLGITPPECGQIFSQVLEEFLHDNAKVRVGWIDCCEECLSSIRLQLKNMRGIVLDTMVLQDFRRNPRQVEENADLIVTTSKHYDEVAFSVPARVDHLEKVMLDLKLDSVIEIVKIPSNCHVSLWSGSQTFLDIMLEVLENFDNLEQIKTYVGENNLAEMAKGLHDTDVLMVPPAYSPSDYPDASALIAEYRSNGGRIIPFDYQLNKGSMVHFEDRVLEIYHAKNNRPFE